MTTGTFLGRFRLNDTQQHSCSCVRDDEQKISDRQWDALANLLKECKAIEESGYTDEEAYKRRGEAFIRFIGEMNEGTTDAEGEPDPTAAERARREGKPLNNQPPATPIERAQSHPGQPRSTGNEPEASHTPPSLPEAGYGILRNGDQASAMGRFLAGIKSKYARK